MRPSSVLGVVALFVPAVLAAVTGADVRPPAASRPATALATPTPTPTPFATAPPWPTTTAVPVSLGAVTRAGTLGFSDGGRSWSYDGPTGRVVEVARPTTAKDGASAPPIANLRQPPDWYATFRIASWSPDGRYVALWKIGLVSASMDADGRQLSVFDVETGASTDLGWTLLDRWLVWRAPHTLAYIAGGNRFTWDHKTLRLWTPETGLRDLTGSDEIALAPVWSADGREILFVRGPSGDYVPLQHFSGTGVGARTLVAIDPKTGDRRTLPAAPGQVQEGVLPSRDGSARLEIRRGTVAPTWKPGDPDPAIEIWYVDGAGAAPLVRLTTIGFGYYGAYPALSSFSWSR